MQAYTVHDAIHQVCHTRHVAAVFHHRDEEEHDDDVRQESEHGTHTLYHAINNQTAPPRRRHQRAAPRAQCVYPHLYPLLRVRAEAESALEDQEEDEYHQREAYPLVGQYLIHSLQRSLLLVVLRVAQTLRQYTVHIRLVGIFIIQVAQVINRVCGRERLVYRLFEQVDDALQTQARLHGYQLQRHTNQRAHLLYIQRVVGLLQEVVAVERHHNLLMLIDDMRRKHQALLQVHAVHHLQDNRKTVRVQVVKVVYLRQLQRHPRRIYQGLQPLRECRLAALRTSHNGYARYVFFLFHVLGC